LKKSCGSFVVDGILISGFLLTEVEGLFCLSAD